MAPAPEEGRIVIPSPTRESIYLHSFAAKRGGQPRLRDTPTDAECRRLLNAISQRSSSLLSRVVAASCSSLCALEKGGER